MIGNSRLHWAWFIGTTLQEAWDTKHLPASAIQQLIQHGVSGILPETIFSPQVVSGQLSDTTNVLPLYLASVVPSQTTLWQTYPAVNVITLAQVPLVGLYPTLGIDRALALLGAGETLGYPVLVIDAGTALTLTGADAECQLIGGAILPGLGLQLKSLTQDTAALPTIQLPTQLPPRWAMQTASAIESGVIYTVLAGMQDFIVDWQSQFPRSQIVLTGGDSPVLLSYLQSQYPQIASHVICNSHVIFWGMNAVRLKMAGEPIQPSTSTFNPST